jgi:hypothetical protein
MKEGFMEQRSYGMGIYGWDDDGLAIVGGFRADGFHAAGHMRTRFQIYDKTRSGSDGNALNVGALVLDLELAKVEGKPHRIVGIIDIEIVKAHRRTGDNYGLRTVYALSDVADADIAINDIKPKAMGFWKKVGCTDFGPKSGALRATLTREAVLDLRSSPAPAP